MTTINGFTAAHAQALADDNVVSAAINGSYHLILTKRNGSTSDAGLVNDLSVLAGRVTTLEGYNAGTRLTALEATAEWIECTLTTAQTAQTSLNTPLGIAKVNGTTGMTVVSNQIKVTKPGRYLIIVNVRTSMAAAVANGYNLGLQVNNTNLTSNYWPGYGVAGNFSMTVTDTFPMVLNDVIDVRVAQTTPTAGAIALATNAITTSRIRVVRVGA